MSDAKPLFGYHRTGYVWTGAVLFDRILPVQVIWQLGFSLQAGWTTQTYGWAALLAMVFGFWSSNQCQFHTFAALLVDVSEDNRSKLVGIVWSMLMVELLLAIISSSLLNHPLDTPIQQLCLSINRLFLDRSESSVD